MIDSIKKFYVDALKEVVLIYLLFYLILFWQEFLVRKVVLYATLRPLIPLVYDGLARIIPPMF